MASARLSWGEAHDQGPRPSDEDAWCLIPDFGGKRHTLFAAVFDGHGGAEAARLAAYFLPRQLEALASGPAQDAEELRQALIRAYEDTSAYLRNRTQSGTTAATVWVTPYGLWYAHVGDTRIVLVQRGEVKRLTRDHKVLDSQEFARLKALGAQFWGPYVVLPDGRGLAVARALGDPAFARFVIPTPEVGFLRPPFEGMTLVIACDGLWDVLADEEAGAMATQWDDPKQAAQALVGKALARGTTDNVTVIVVRISDPP
ncbi:MAG: PP2C family serine/threonine-protein phosphatase [Dehalococcoidia bacterium]